MSIYPVNENYKTLVSIASDYAEMNGGEIEDRLCHLLERSEERLNECISGLMADIENTRLDIDSLKCAKSDIDAKINAKRDKAERMKIVLANVLGNESFSDGVFSTSKKVTRSLKITGDIPEKYKSVKIIPETTKEVIDNTSIKNDLIENGGIFTWAEIVEKKAVK